MFLFRWSSKRLVRIHSCLSIPWPFDHLLFSFLSSLLFFSLLFCALLSLLCSSLLTFVSSSLLLSPLFPSLLFSLRFLSSFSFFLLRPHLLHWDHSGSLTSTPYEVLAMFCTQMKHFLIRILKQNHESEQAKEVSSHPSRKNDMTFVWHPNVCLTTRSGITETKVSLRSGTTELNCFLHQ